MEEYLGIIAKNGFVDTTVHKQKAISIPEDLLANYLTPEEIARFQNRENGIFSITVSGYKQS
jgi:hypothetical protein